MLTTLFASLLGPYPIGTLYFLAAVALVAGLSRGLTGFGAGMIFIPLASGLIGPSAAIGVMWVVDQPATLPIALRAIRRAQVREVAWLFAGWLLMMPVGIWLLKVLDKLTVRWIMCLMILIVLALLMGGWRYKGKPTVGLAVVTGLIAGLAGGLTGLSGPPIVLLWLAAAATTAMNVRDNINLFFLISGAFSGFLFIQQGILTWDVLGFGLLLLPAYALGIILGTRMFKRMGEADFRRAAYIVIAIAALLALPALDPWLRK